MVKSESQIVKEYFESWIKYSKKYTKFALLYQSGKFYNVFGVNNNEENLGDIDDIMHHLSLHETGGKKENSSRIAPRKAGFPVKVANKYIKLLLENKYVVIIYDQYDNPNPRKKTDKFIRKFERMISSKGTYLDDDDIINKPDSNDMIMIYVEKTLDKEEEDTYDIGLTTIDISTGKSSCYSIIDNLKKSSEFINRLVSTLNPTDIIIAYKPSKTLTLETKIFDLFDIKSDNIKTQTITKIPKEYFKPSYHNEFLSQIFQSPNLTTIVEILGLEYYNNVIVSLILILQYLYEHDPNILNKISKPVFKDQSSWLQISSRTINQLDIINNSEGKKSLYDIINKCVTGMGKRLLKKRLTQPLIDPKIINERYEILAFFIKDKNYQKLKEYLKHIPDIERLHRRLFLGKLVPSDLKTLEQSYIYIWKLIKCISRFQGEENKNISSMLSQSTIKQFRKMVTIYHNRVELDEASKYNSLDIETMIFKKGLFEELDNLSLIINSNMEKLEEHRLELSGYLETDKDLKLTYTDKLGYYYTTSQKRSKILKENFPDITIETLKSQNRIFDKVVRKCSTKIMNAKDSSLSLNKKYFLEFLKFITENFHETLKLISNYVAQIDVAYSLAFVSDVYKYCKPIIIPGDKSFIDAKELRHPIVERINQNELFIPNDIKIGGIEEDVPGKNILLYGVNSSGKSILLKQTSLAIIMAQMGMYVAATSFTYSPIEYLVTKIYMMDDLYRHKSAFECEMLDLKNMLTNTGPKSLFLADELCSGTSTIDALSLVGATLHDLSSTHSNYIFTTHLHQLTEITLVKNIKNLELYHIKTHLQDNKIIFDRILTKGKCDVGSWGIEVAKQMGIGDKEFHKNVLTIERELTGQPSVLLSTKTSKYNKDKYIHKCEFCGIALPKELETHHKSPQKDANEYGMINHFHKNSKFNLQTLCRECHIFLEKKVKENAK